LILYRKAIDRQQFTFTDEPTEIDVSWAAD